MNDNLEGKFPEGVNLAPLGCQIKGSSYRYLMDIGGLKAEVVENCSPQEVYDYEFLNHECGWTGDDEEAIQIVVHYFGVDRAKEVKRVNI